jgi:cyclic lactone autoinducer peptide
MKKTFKTNILEVVVKVAKKSALIGADSASVWGFHQPKEPETLKNLKK